MENQDLHRQAAEQEDGMSAAYVVKSFAAVDMPAAYVGMVYAKWLRSLRYGNHFFKLVQRDAFFIGYHKYLDVILSKDNSIVRFAVLADDHDVVLGFSVCRYKTLDYVWVHKHNRKIGIATALVPNNIDTISHITNVGLSIWGSKYSHWQFNPFA